MIPSTVSVTIDPSLQHLAEVVKNDKVFNIIEKVKATISSRRRLSYSVLDVSLSFIKWWFCWKHRNYDYKHRMKIFDEGHHKLTKEMDLVSTIDSVKKLEIITNFLLDENQKFMLNYNKNCLLSSGSNTMFWENAQTVANKIPPINDKFIFDEEYQSKIMKLTEINFSSKKQIKFIDDWFGEITQNITSVNPKSPKTEKSSPKSAKMSSSISITSKLPADIPKLIKDNEELEEQEEHEEEKNEEKEEQEEEYELNKSKLGSELGLLN